MSDEIKYVDADSEEFEDAPRALRDAYKKLVKAHQGTVAEFNTLRSTTTQKAADDVLAGKGFKNPARVKQALLDDNVDPLDSSAVETWLSSNGDDYAKAAQLTDEQEQQPAETVSEETQQKHQSLQVSHTEPATNEKFAAVQAKITPEMTGADVRKLYAEHGV